MADGKSSGSDEMHSLVYLTVTEAAELLRISPKTLERMRVDGTGPDFRKAGGGLRSRVLYRKQDLIDWVEGYAFSSTSEYQLRR